MEALENQQVENFVQHLLSLWKVTDIRPTKVVWDTVVQTMQFVATFPWENGKKKEVALNIVKRVLDETDSPGWDLLVDHVVYWMVDEGIDYLYDAWAGRFNFGDSGN